jgi:WD40 repeat protein
MRPDLRSAALLGLLTGLVAGCGGPTPPTIVERQALSGHTREVVSIAFAPDGKTLASRDADAVRVWDLGDGRGGRTFPSGGSDFGSLAFSPDGATLAENRPGSAIVVRDLASGRKRVFKGKDSAQVMSCDSTAHGWGLAYSPDGKTLAAGGSHGGEDGFLSLWETTTGEGVELAPLRRPITTVAFSSDGRTIASGSMDGKLVLWDASTRAEKLQIEANRSYLAPVCFSPDGRVVASANESRSVKLWDSSTGREVGSMRGHLKAVLSIAFSPDGKALVSGDSGGTIFVWDVPSKRMMTRLEPLERGKVWCLAFSPDGKTLACGGEDRMIRLWDVTWPNPVGKGR